MAGRMVGSYDRAGGTDRTFHDQLPHLAKRNCCCVSSNDLIIQQVIIGYSNDMERSPWICHICDYTSAETESKACDLCYRVTCSLHLRPASIYNQNNHLYETAAVCIACAADNAKKNQ
jgi:hypothetical protein